MGSISGFFLVAEKLKPVNGFSGQNIILAAGGIVFFFMVFALSLNQGKTLRGIKLALEDFEREQNKKVTERAERLSNLLTSTWSHYRRVVQLLWAVRILLMLFTLVVAVAFVWCSVPSWQHKIPYNIKEPGQPLTTNTVAIQISSDPSGSLSNTATKPVSNNFSNSTSLKNIP